MGMSGVELSKSDVIKAIKAKGGVVRHAAKMLGCHETTIFNIIDRDREVEAALIAARKQRESSYVDQDLELVDEARQTLLRAIKNDSVPAAIYVAKTKGKFEEVKDFGSRVTLKIDNK